MASGSRVPMKKQYKSSSKRARESDFDSTRFISSTASKVFSEILPQENLTDCYYFNFGSLERAHLGIQKFFSDIGIDKFVSCKEPIFPGLVREFYANLHVDTSEQSASLALRSKVGGDEVIVSSEILDEVFGLSNDGFSCTGQTLNEETDLSEREIMEFLKSKTVIEVTDAVFENNDFGINIRLLLVAFTKCIMPKVNTQHKLVEVDRNVVYHVLNKDRVDFASIVIGWMKTKSEMFRSKHYASRSRKAGMPFGSILTMIFRYHNIDLTSEPSLPVSRGHEICDTSLKAMHYVETLNRGWILYSYLQDDDRLPHEMRMPTPAERITRRGPETLQEFVDAARAHRPKGKSKMNIPNTTKKDFDARIRSLETTQNEMRQDIQSLRTEVQALHTNVQGVHNLLEDFIRFSHPTFSFASSQANQNP
ncbi:hypothetical protein OROHE_018315 [Orobanche hederae]